jgi:hypothetical protein
MSNQNQETMSVFKVVVISTITWWAMFLINYQIQKFQAKIEIQRVLQVGSREFKVSYGLKNSKGGIHFSDELIKAESAAEAEMKLRIIQHPGQELIEIRIQENYQRAIESQKSSSDRVDNTKIGDRVDNTKAPARESYDDKKVSEKSNGNDEPVYNSGPVMTEEEWRVMNREEINE